MVVMERELEAVAFEAQGQRSDRSASRSPAGATSRHAVVLEEGSQERAEAGIVSDAPAPRGAGARTIACATRGHSRMNGRARRGSKRSAKTLRREGSALGSATNRASRQRSSVGRCRDLTGTTSS